MTLTLSSKEQRAQDVARQILDEKTTLMESRVKVHTWRVGIKERALERDLLQEQVCLYPLAIAPPPPASLTLTLTLTLTLPLTLTRTRTLYTLLLCGFASFYCTHFFPLTV